MTTRESSLSRQHESRQAAVWIDTQDWRKGETSNQRRAAGRPAGEPATGAADAYSQQPSQSTAGRQMSARKKNTYIAPNKLGPEKAVVAIRKVHPVNERLTAMPPSAAAPLLRRAGKVRRFEL